MTSTKSKAAAISITSNTLLISMKLVAGLITGSVSLIAEAIHSTMDLAAAVIAFICVRISDKPVDKNHPYGHGKAENISGVIEGVLILIAAGIIVNESIHKIIEGTELKIVEVGIVIMAISIVVNVVVSRHLLKVAKATDSLALEADAAHLTTDVLTMSGVLIGLVAVKLTGIEIIDPIVAIMVALLIVKAGIQIIAKSFGGLMDTSLPESEKAAIEKCILEHSNQLVGFHELRTRKSGSQRQIDLHLVLHKTVSVEDAHKLCGHLEADIGNILPNAITNIHVEPCDSSCKQCIGKKDNQ